MVCVAGAIPLLPQARLDRLGCLGQSSLNMRMRLLFGLKWVRFVEWTRDVQAEKPGLTEFYDMTVLTIKSVLQPIGRKAYIRRLRICHRCPVFNRKLKSCRNGEHGCGCYTPYKALGPVDCWLREQNGAVVVNGRLSLPKEGWGKKDPQ